MPAQFDHERLKVYQDALRFVVWASPIIEDLPGKLAAKDQLDRASTSIVLNIAEGNGQRSHPDRCRYLDIARGAGVECAACLDVLVVENKMSTGLASEGRAILLARRFHGDATPPSRVTRPRRRGRRRSSLHSVSGNHRHGEFSGLEVVSLTAGLIARFSGEVQGVQASNEAGNGTSRGGGRENEND